MSKQNKFLLWTAVIVVISAIIGYSKRDNKAPVKSTEPSTSSELRLITPEFDVEVEATTEGHYFTVRSNLPESTEILITLANDIEPNLGQSSGKIRNGSMKLGPFRQSDDIHAVGDYTLNVTVPIIRNQAESVKAILGENGENLRGELVAEAFGSRVIETDIAVHLPLPAGQTESLSDAGNIEGAVDYTTFKQRFGIGALQHRSPFTLADSLIKDGNNADTMQVFFSENADLQLIMEPDTREIRSATMYVTGPKANGDFVDISYALSVIWGFENVQSTDAAQTILDYIRSLEPGEPWVSDSGFRYSRPEGTDGGMMFFVTDPRLEK